MRPHPAAGDMARDWKAMRNEIIQLKAKLSRWDDKDADRILKPRKESTPLVPVLSGGQFESKRRKF